MVAAPESTREEFIRMAKAAVETFGTNPMFAKIDAGQFALRHYHGWLRTIFHQVFQSAPTFAMAGANCDLRMQPIRDYLIEHAEEERTHWRWVLDDLSSTGYTGPDPRSEMPNLPTQNYISLNFFLASRTPVARLGTAAVLEGIGATYSKRYSEAIGAQLGFKPDQLSFAYGHGDTDVGHTEDIYRVLSEADLSSYEWAWCTHAARMAGQLYGQMYEGMSA